MRASRRARVLDGQRHHLRRAAGASARRAGAAHALVQRRVSVQEVLFQTASEEAFLPVRGYGAGVWQRVFHGAGASAAYNVRRFDDRVYGAHAGIRASDASAGGGLGAAFDSRHAGVRDSDLPAGTKAAEADGAGDRAVSAVYGAVDAGELGEHPVRPPKWKAIQHKAQTPDMEREMGGNA